MRFLPCFILLLFFSCNHPQSPTEKRTGVFVELSSPHTSIEQLTNAEITAVIHNNTSRDTALPMWVMDNSIYALDVTDEKGEEIPSIPPSVPPADLHAYDSLLPAGSTMTLQYDLNIYQVSIPKGNYHVRMHSLPSNEIIFTVTKGN